MGKVEVISINGVDLVFFSNDHNPPHFHAKKAGEWEYRVYFMRSENMLEAKWEEQRMTGKLRRELIELVVANRLALLTEWEAKVNP